MTTKMTAGKLAGLKAVSDARGVIAAAAMDQRGSLKKSLAKEKGVSDLPDSALVEFAAPGLPAFQAFIRGLAPGVPDTDSPSLAQSFVRPVEPLARGDIPTTAAAFGGTPEFTTIGGGLFERW